MLLYYITDRGQFAGSEPERQQRLLERISRAAAAGIELVQLREKDLPARTLAQLAEAALNAIRRHGSGTRLLINSRLDVALACGADGVHLTSTDPGPAQARGVARLAASGRREEALLVAVSCHSVAEVRRAAEEGADLVVLAPIFEKILPARERQSGIGCEILRQACSPAPPGKAVPVLALGGVNLTNARACIEAGAAGIAGIRLFQEGNLEETVRRLRAE
ncbi:MAG: thiamine phosphate synthase [Candidatus Korobacteraceae bacterium]|jgi:thiamine-phosphate pyrophosphorylase